MNKLPIIAVLLLMISVCRGQTPVVESISPSINSITPQSFVNTPLAFGVVHINGDLLSAKTTTAMFGPLPKGYSAASVLICSSVTESITVPLARLSQQVRPSGVVLLPRDAALAVIAAAQGSSKSAKAFRAGVAAIELAAIAAGWSGLSLTIKGTLESAALAGSSTLGVFSTAIPTHTYLTFDHEAIPDTIQIGPRGCAPTGIVIVETKGVNSSIDVLVALP